METPNPTESGTVAVAEKPATAVTFDANDQHTWSGEQRAHWNATGERPASPSKADSATASSSEKKTDPAPEGKSAAESGAAPKPEKKETGKPTAGKPPADDRIAQLVAERETEREKVRALEDRLKRLESPTSKTETTDAKAAKAPEAPKRPNPFTWTGTAEEFEQAMDKWESHLTETAARTVQQQEQARQQQAHAEAALNEAQKKYPDAKEKIVAATEQLLKSSLPVVFKQFVNESEVFTDVLYVLSDGETLANLVETAKSNPGKAFRALADIERNILAETKKTPAAEKTDAKTEATDDASPKKPAPRAPKPPAEVGGRGAATERADHAAAREGNFKAFEEEMNRKARAMA